MDQQQYAKLVKQETKNSSCLKNCLKAFLIGGAICTVGEGLSALYTWLGAGEDNAKLLVSVSLIALGILLTALHLYDKLARHGGAGTLVPITGFANSMSAPAIEFKTEGMITGIGAKMFIIAGPVLVYGTAAAMVYGVIYWFLSR